MKRRHLKDCTQQNLSYLSPYHQKVQVSKQQLKQKQAIKSIYLMGRLEKMELNAINNKSLRINMIAKKAEKMYKKVFQHKQIFSPETNQIKIDNRERRSSKKQSTSQRKFDVQFNKICQVLINQYIEKIKSQNLLLKSLDRKFMIEQACKQIKQKLKKEFPLISLQQEQQILKQFDRKTQRSSLPYVSNIQVGNVKVKKSKIKRSITEAQCNENLVKLNKEESYFSKKRQQDQKIFLRRMKFIVDKNKTKFKNGFSQRNRRVYTQVQKLGQIGSRKNKLLSPITLAKV